MDARLASIKTSIDDLKSDIGALASHDARLMKVEVLVEILRDDADSLTTKKLIDLLKSGNDADREELVEVLENL